MPETTGTPEVQPIRGWRWWLLGVFAIVTLLHFPPVDNFLDNDDAWNYVLESERFLDGEGSAWVEGGSYFAHQNLQRLLPSLTWIVRYGLFDLWMPAWHLPSILVHALNALLLVVVARRLGLSPEVAVLSGLWFGLSPVHPHVVSWIGGTYDIFCGAFLLGMLIAFVDRRTMLGVACCVGALLSKETGVFAAPILAMYVLLWERSDGWRAAARRLAPYVGATVVVIGLRLLQIMLRGSIDQAGLPARTIGFDLWSLLVVGPEALLLALGAPFRGLVPVGLSGVSVLFGGLLLTGLAAWKALRLRAVWFGIASAWMLIVPVLLMREEGLALDLNKIVLNARYLYLPLLLAAPLAALALVGTKAPPIGARTLAVAAVALALITSGRDVLVLTQVEPPVRVVAETVRSAEIANGSRVYVLANVHEEASFRLLLSRWLARAKQAEFIWVQRGAWRAIHRRPQVPFGLDFRDYYLVASPQPFDPSWVDAERGDKVYLLSNGGTDGGHALRAVQMPPPGALASGRVQAIESQWSAETVDIQAGVELRGDGGLAFQVTATPDRPGGYDHKPLARTGDLWIAASSVYAIRITYSATGRPVTGRASEFAYGYLEVHWAGDGAQADDSFVVTPLVLDGQTRTIDLPVWFDPVWYASGSIAWIGITPYDLPVEVRVDRVELVLVSGG